MSAQSTNVIILPPLTDMKLRTYSTLPNSPELVASSSRCSIKKRRRLSPKGDDKGELIVALNGSKCPVPRATKSPPLSATHEIRLLRSQVAGMEEELRVLQKKWTTQLPDHRTFTLAQHSAREKHGALRTETVHNELQQMLLEQQLLFATLQTAVLRAPLQSQGQALFEALHFDTHLGRDANEREKLLFAHKERSLATLPSIANKFTQLAIDKVVATQTNGQKNAKCVMPLSQIDITGCNDCTLISSIFISEIPHTSLEEVYAAVLAYFDGIPTAMKRHFNVNAKRVRLNSVDSPVVYRRSTFKGAGLPAIVNNVVCSELTPSHGMVHIDAIVDDPMHPVSRNTPSQYGICGLTLTPRKEAVTGRTMSVTLRWMVVYNYNILPDDPALKDDLEIIRPILNGDLLTATVCGYIQERQQQQRPRN